MGSNVIFFGWNRSIPGRERLSAAHFQEFVEYLAGLRQSGTIQSFDTVFLNIHGGGLNGFFLIRGETGKLRELTESAAWIGHLTRASLHLEGASAVLGATGDAVMERMQLWTGMLPA